MIGKRLKIISICLKWVILKFISTCRTPICFGGKLGGTQKWSGEGGVVRTPYLPLRRRVLWVTVPGLKHGLLRHLLLSSDTGRQTPESWFSKDVPDLNKNTGPGATCKGRSVALNWCCLDRLWVWRTQISLVSADGKTVVRLTKVPWRSYQTQSSARRERFAE